MTKRAPVLTGKTVGSPGINKAIEPAKTARGDTIVFPVGHHISFSIRISSRVDLPLQGTLHFPARPPLLGWIQDSSEPKAAWMPSKSMAITTSTTRSLGVTPPATSGSTESWTTALASKAGHFGYQNRANRVEGRIASSPLPSFYLEELRRADFIAITVAAPAARVFHK